MLLLDYGVGGNEKVMFSPNPISFALRDLPRDIPSRRIRPHTATR